MIILALGANSGNPSRTLPQALEHIAALPKTTLQRSSGSYRTEPISEIDQPDFINQCVAITTDLSPEALMHHLHKIEKDLGRDRTHEKRSGPRPIDIDLLFYGNQIIETDDLTLPHPRLHERRFVLVPLAEIAPEFTHPVLNKTVEELLRACRDEGRVEPL